MYHIVQRNYAVVVLGPLLSGPNNPTDQFCYDRAWPPEASLEYCEVTQKPADCKE